MKKQSRFSLRAGNGIMTWTLRAAPQNYFVFEELTRKVGAVTGNVELLKSAIAAEAIEQDWAGLEGTTTRALEDWSAS